MAPPADDPFACFGDDEDDKEEEEFLVPTAAWAGKQLVERANDRIVLKASQSDGNGSATGEGNDETDGRVKKETQPQNASSVDYSSSSSLLDHEISLWPDSPPMYLNQSVKLVSSLPVGGGRGFVATRKLTPGTLVLVEEPVLAWPEEQLGKPLDLVSVEHILRSPLAQTIVRDMEDFHPTKEQVDGNKGDAEQVSAMMQHLSVQHEDDSRVQKMVELAESRGIVSQDGTALDGMGIRRLLLALRYNGLQSGVYRHVAMLNHSCHPNCVKFMPTKGPSEVRATRTVSAGDSLTISYLPRIESHASRRTHLWDQHRFDIGDELGQWRFMELIDSKQPPSALIRWDESAVTVRIENTLAQLEDHHQEVAQSLAGDVGGTSSVLDEAMALEMTSYELWHESLSQLQNDSHVLLIPCLRLHLDMCDLVQRESSLTSSQRILLLCRLVESSWKLRELQKWHHGLDHFDLAQSNLELAQGLEELLSRSPKQLQQLNLPGMTSFAAGASAEHAARQEYDRIRALYPHDTEQIIRQKVA